MPSLVHWLPLYAVTSVLSIAATYLALRLAQHGRLRRPIAREVVIPTLGFCGHLTAWGIAATSVVLLAASAFDVQLGLPTFLAGLTTAVLVLICSRSNPLKPIKSMSWGILPLVAGLFVLVQAMERTGVIAALASMLHDLVQHSENAAAWLAGGVVAFGCNLVNNLPAGLVAGRAAQAAQAPEPVRAALLIGVDLGPNLSVTGSLATILWLSALRRDGFHVSAWRFLKLGLLVMPPSLLLAIAGAFAFG
jgi:arsenical pump membrane protein